MAPQREIVITGMGVVSPIGIGKAAFADALAAGRGGIRRLDLFEDAELPNPIGGEVVDFDAKLYVRPRKSLKVMSRDIQFGFAAADMACVDAGLRDRPPDPERLGVMFGADLMPCELPEMAATYRGCTVGRPVSSSTAGARPRWPTSSPCGCSSICRTCRPATSASPRTRAARTTR